MSMTKRARYDGPYESVRVAVLHQGIVGMERLVTVKRGDTLPSEMDGGEAVPASVHDDLIANNPDFSAVTSRSSTGNDKDGEK